MSPVELVENGKTNTKSMSVVKLVEDGRSNSKFALQSAALFQSENEKREIEKRIAVKGQTFSH